MYNVYIFPKFGKHIICSWILKVNMFIQLEVYISIQKLSLFGDEQSFCMKVKVRDFEAMKGIDYIAETNTD